MKKIQLMIVGLAGLLASGMVSATSLEGTVTYKMTDCGLLANDIKVSLSSNVVGDIACDDTTNNIVAVSVCHEAGLTSARSSEVTTCVDDGAGGETCTSAIETVEGSAFPSASSTRGTVSSRFPGAACTAGNAATETAAMISGS